MLNKDLNQLSQDIHAANVEKGWWDNDPCIYTKMQLISTEIAEATEGWRKDLMDDHLPHRKMEEVELADALIRTLDLGGRLGLVYDVYRKDEVDFEGDSCILGGHPKLLYTEILYKSPLLTGAKHLALTLSFSSFAEVVVTLLYNKTSNTGAFSLLLNEKYSQFVKDLLKVAETK